MQSAYTCIAVFAAVFLAAASPAQAQPAGDPTLGLSALFPSNAALTGKPLINLAAVKTRSGVIYVADLYGDGLIRFQIARKVAGPLLAGAAAMQAELDIDTVSEIVGNAALGSLSPAVSLRQDKTGIVLEAAETTGEAQAEEHAASLDDLGGPKRQWKDPSRVPTKKSRAKQQATVQTFIKAQAQTLKFLMPHDSADQKSAGPKPAQQQATGEGYFDHQGNRRPTGSSAGWHRQ